MLWRSAVVLGPIGCSRAEASWLLSTPADRTTLLLPAGGRALLAAILGGAVLGWLGVAAATGADVGLLLTGALGGAGVAVATVLLAVARQPSRRGPASLAPGRLALAAAVGCAVLALVPGLRSWVPGTLPSWADVSWAAGSWAAAAWSLPALAVASTGLLLAAALVAARRLDQIPLPELQAAGNAQQAVHGSVVLIDSSNAATGLRGRGRTAGRARSRRGRASGGLAVVLREGQQLARRPGRLAGAFGLLVVPALLLLLAGPLVAEVAAVLLALRVARTAAGSWRTVTGPGGLERSFPFSALHTAGLLLVVPVLVSVAWSGAAAVLFGRAPWAAVAVGASAVAGVVRGSSPRQGGGPGPLVMTEAGPVPVGLLASLVRGPDVTLLAAAPLLLDAGAVASSALPLLALA